MNVMKIYNRLPVFLQNAATSCEGWRIQKTRYDSTFDRIYNDYMERNDWSYQQKCEYRDRQLRQMVEHCYKNVPYYHRTFDERGIDYRQIQTLEDLKVLPIIDKQTIKDNYDDFFAVGTSRKGLVRQHTSGSTGAGFVFYLTKEAYAAVWANGWRGYHNVGLDRGVWCGYFCGRAIVPKEQRIPPYYRINRPGKQILFSAYHTYPEALEEYVAALNRYKPMWIHGYPSFVTTVAKHILDSDDRLKYTPAAITLGSENVQPWQEERIEKAFGKLPIQNYGQTEAVAAFWQRDDRRIFVDEDYSAVEFVPTGDGDLCRIIGTTLTNYAMPFLRYDTRDLATYEENQFGRQVLSLDGRQEDIVKLRDGSSLGRLDHIFKDQTLVAGAQIIQEDLDTLTVRIVRQAGFSPANEKQLTDTLDGYFKGRIGYRVEYTDAIPSGANGKQRFVVSKLNGSQGERKDV